MSEFAELEILLAEIKPDIFIISEKRLFHSTPDSLIPLTRRFQVFRCEREASIKDRGGGIAILVDGYKNNVETAATPRHRLCELISLDIIADKTFRLVSAYWASDICILIPKL